MSAESRKLQVGDLVSTDYDVAPAAEPRRIVRITGVERGTRSQSGVMFRVWPPLKHGSALTWYDADWFEPCMVERSCR